MPNSSYQTSPTAATQNGESAAIADSEILAAALACIRAALSIVPIDHRTKRPAMHLLPKGEDGKPTWKPYQSEIADEATVRNWFGRGCKAFALVCGDVSGGLLVLDFDEPRFYEVWRASVGARADGIPIQQTGGGNYQALMYCADPGANDKLAYVVDEREDAGRSIAIETRGEGGYAVVAPSRHPTGNIYKMLVGSLAAIPVVDQTVADALVDAARKLDEMPHTRQELERIESEARTEHRRQHAQCNGQASVIDAFNKAHPIEEMLESNGYTPIAGGRFKRPGGASPSVSVKDGKSCHFSSNDPLNDGRVKSGLGVHDSLDVWAYFNYSGNVSAAVKAAAELLGMSYKAGDNSDNHRSDADSDPDAKNGALVFSPADPLPIARAFRFTRFHHDDGFTLLFGNGVFKYHNGTRYVDLQPDAIRSRMYEFLEPTQKWVTRGKEPELKPFAPNSASVSNGVDALRAVCFTDAQAPCWLVDDPGLPDPAEILAMQNGLVRLPANGSPKLLRPPTPLWFSPNAVDYPFMANAPTPVEWLKFLGALWPNDRESIELLQEWCGYILTADTRLQKILLLIGPPRSGKGTIARVLSHMIGLANVCAPTLAGLAMDFGLWGLVGTLVAIISDARLSGRTDQAIVTERLLSISGEDAIEVQRKFMEPITVRIFARLMLLTNEMPRLSDASGALANRFVVLRLTRSFLGKEDTGLTERLLLELPGILAWSIAGWQRLRARGRFVQPTSSQHAVDEMMELSSPVSAFISDYCAVRPGLSCTVAELFDGWRAWCAEQGREQAGNSATFGRDLRAAQPGIETRQRREDGKRQRTYEGIDLTETGKMAAAKCRAARTGTRDYPLHA
jgi:putative DNA primase/helicase